MSSDGAATKQTIGVWGGRVRRWWRSVAVTAFVLGAGVVAAMTYLGPTRGDHETTAAAAQALDAAKQGAVALLSYTPTTLDDDLAKARTHLTGEFLTYYSQFADQILIPAAKQKDVHASASVVRAAVIDAHPDTADVLIFVNQNTTSKDNPVSVPAASSVKVGLTKVDGAWRISSFDPV